jgi:hypothetical protein
LEEWWFAASNDGGVVDEVAIGEKFRALAGELNERQRRLWAASEARAAGRGGIAATARATGISVPTIRKGIAELEAGERLDAGRVRRPGGGRRALTETDPTLLRDLERLVSESSRGDPESLLLWTSRSVRHLAAALREQGHAVHFTTVAKLLGLLGYSLQANVKTREGASHPDRDAQFGHINAVATAAVAAGEPVISVDTKKKELVGDFKNAGREWRPKGEPELVRVHDFKDKQLGKAIPYGVYDIAANQGWVSVGIITTPLSSRSTRSAAGGNTSDTSATPTRPGCRSPPTAAAQTATASVCGRSSCKDSPTKPAWRSASVTSRPAPANGTGSSTACSATSRSTGAASRCIPCKPSST